MLRRGDQEAAGVLSNPVRRGNNRIRAPTQLAPPISRRSLFRLPSCGQMLTKEACQLIEGNEVHAVVEVDVTGCLDPNQLLRFGSALVGVFAEFLRMRLISGDEQHRAWRDRLNVV